MDDRTRISAVDRLTDAIIVRIRPVTEHLSVAERLRLATRMAVLELRYFEKASLTRAEKADRDFLTLREEVRAKAAEYRVRSGVPSDPALEQLQVEMLCRIREVLPLMTDADRVGLAVTLATMRLRFDEGHA